MLFEDEDGSLRSDIRPSRALFELEKADVSLDRLMDLALLATIDNETGAPSTECIRFTHDVFKEFLIAEALAKDEDWLGRARSHYRDDTWNGVLELLAGMLGARCGSLISDIMDQHGITTGCEAERLVCLSARCLGEVPRGVRIDEALVVRIASALMEVARRPHVVNNSHSVLRALGRSGQHFLPVLITSLHDEVWWVRPLVADALVRIGPGSIPLLIEALKSDDPAMRAYAAEAIGQIGDRGTSALAALLPDDDVNVFKASARALAAIGSVESISSLIRSLADPRPYARAVVAIELGNYQARVGDRLALPEHLLPLLIDSDLNVSHGAAMALGRIGDASTMPRLAIALGHEDRNVRSNSAFAIDTILHRLGKTLGNPPGAAAVAAWFGCGRFSLRRVSEKECLTLSSDAFAAIAAHVTKSYPERVFGVLLGPANGEGISDSAAWPATALEVDSTLTFRGYYKSFTDDPILPRDIFGEPGTPWLLVNCFFGTGVAMSAFVTGEDAEDWRSLALRIG